MTYTKLSNLDELRAMTQKQLQEEVSKRLRLTFKLRLLQTNGENGVKPHLFKTIRRDVARIKTIMREVGVL